MRSKARRIPGWIASAGQILERRALDYEERNTRYDGDPDRLDTPDLDGVLLRPQPFSSSSDRYAVDLLFHSLAGQGAVAIEACAIDLKDNAICATAEGFFNAGLYLPLILR